MIQPAGEPSGRLGVFTVDERLVVRAWDAWLEAATGITAADAQGTPLDSLVPDLESRGLRARFVEVLQSGEPQVLASAFHKYLFACPPAAPSGLFERMQQRVILGPLRDGARIVGVIATVEDVTARIEDERGLAQALRSDDPATREAAAKRIAAAEGIESTDAFAAVLGHDDWRVRRNASQGLAPHAHRDMLAALLTGLREGHRDFNVLSSALTLLAHADVDLSGPLVELLHDPDPDLRMQAALALGDHHRSGGIEALIGALQDPDPNVRFHAIEALGRLRAGEATDPLADLAETGDFFLAFPAIDALARLNDPRVTDRLLRLLPLPLLQAPVIDALGDVAGGEAVGPLIVLLNENGPADLIARALVRIHARYEDRFSGGAYVASEAQRAVGPRGVQALIDALGDPRAADVKSLVICLGWLRGRPVERTLTLLLGRSDLGASVIEAVVRQGSGVVDLLIEQLHGPDDEARQAAIVALGRIGDHRATPALTALLDSDRATVIAVAAALAHSGDPAAFEPLLPLLARPDATVRKAAIGALNSIGHPAMAKRVCALLNEGDPVLRESAVRIAGYFGYAECRDTIVALAGDPDERVRRAVYEHLPYLEDPRAADLLASALERDAPAARAAAAQALGQADASAASGPLIRALQDADGWVRYYACRSLARLRATGAVAALSGLASHEAAGHVRIAALEAIGAIDGPEVTDLLLPFVASGDDDVAAAALRGLGRVSDPRATAAIREALRAPGVVRRLAAIHGLGARRTAEAIAALEWAASGDADGGVASAALEALAAAAQGADAPADSAVVVLVRLASDPDRGGRALAALASLPVSRIDAVAATLIDPSPGVRLAAVDALGRMRHPAASAAIQEALSDEDPRVRARAVTTLDGIGARGVGPALARLARHDPSHAVRRAAAAALSRAPQGDAGPA